MRRLFAVLLVTGTVACADGALGGAMGGIAAWPLAGCSALNCTGCCDDDDNCRPGGETTACGNNGSQCMACPGNQLCADSFSTGGMECQVCDSSNCDGCCDAAGACRSGTEDTACGLFECDVCPSGYVCLGRQCQ